MATRTSKHAHKSGLKIVSIEAASFSAALLPEPKPVGRGSRNRCDARRQRRFVSNTSASLEPCLHFSKPFLNVASRVARFHPSPLLHHLEIHPLYMRYRGAALAKTTSLNCATYEGLD